MSDVQFDEQQTSQDTSYKSHEILGAYRTPSMSRIVMRIPGIKNEKQAYYVLWGILIVCCLITLYVLFTQIRPADVKTINLNIPIENV
jgi:hypothetical protein